MMQLLGSNPTTGTTQLWQEINGVMTLVGSANTVFNELNAHLDANRPILAGINYKPGHTGNNDNTTDHWVVIIGRGYDAVRQQYCYIYVETGRWSTNPGAAVSNNNRLYYNLATGMFATDNRAAMSDRTL